MTLFGDQPQLSLSGRAWAPSHGTAEAELKSVEELAPTLLAARGIESGSQPPEIFDPKSSNPISISGLEEAAMQVAAALKQRSKVGIYADFDCDGICAAALLQIFLRGLGTEPFLYFSDRLRDGYGLNERGLNECFDAGVKLLLALDIGANAQSEIDHANGLGIAVVVVDHHVAAEPLRGTAAAVDPPAGSPGSELSAGALAYKLAEVLSWKLGRQIPVASSLIDLAAISTVGDAMELTGENRWFVSTGLEAMARQPRPGLAALFAAARIHPPLTARDIAFRIAPLINSAGRIGDPRLACRLLACPGGLAARNLAKELIALGKRRRELSAEVERVLVEKIPPAGPVFYFDERFHPGVVSAAATRQSARRQAPVYICAKAGELVRGSGRAPDGLDVMAPLQSLDPPPRQLGGHRQACGFTIAAERLDEVAAAVTSYWENMADGWQPPALKYDMCLATDLLGTPALDLFDRFEPFGRGFEAPNLLIRGALLERVFSVGRGQHLKLALADANAVDVIWFGGGRKGRSLRRGQRVDMIGQLRRPQVGYSGISVIVEDMRPA